MIPWSNWENREGYSAPLLAAKNGHHKVCKELINAGADLSMTDKEGNSALDHATTEGKEQVVLLLSQAMQKANSKK